MKDKRGNWYEMMIQDGVEPELLAGTPTKEFPATLEAIMALTRRWISRARLSFEFAARSFLSLPQGTRRGRRGGSRMNCVPANIQPLGDISLQQRDVLLVSLVRFRFP
jgi:hypothetical protein